MALTDQPYLPLYVDDWMNNNKLKMCSPGAHGLMISIMCLMHKSEEYGIILLKQKFKQSNKQRQNFASQIAKLTSFDLLEIENYFYELIDENVLEIDGEKLICWRMFKDGETSKNRSFSGRKGGSKTQDKLKNFAKANSQANTGIESVNENGIVNEDDNVNVNPNLIPAGKSKIDYEAIVQIFNSVCVNLPKVSKLSEKRKSLLKNRISESSLEALGDVFRKVSESRFLNGENKNGWKADFDWILNPSNYLKISEDNYKNPNHGGQQKSTAEQFSNAINSDAAKNFRFGS